MGQKFREYKGLDLVNVADEILRFWDDNDIFEKSKTEEMALEIDKMNAEMMKAGKQ